MTRAISPEMQRRGFVPASPSKGWRRSNMLMPKPTSNGRRGFVPAIDTVALNWALADVTPIERQALEYIVENADLIAVEGGAGFLLIEAPPKLLDILATLGAEAHDRENDLEDEAEDPNPDHGNHWSLTEDSEPDYDNEYDFRKEQRLEQTKLPVVRVRRASR